MVGTVFTAILKAGRLIEANPSEAVITMPVVVPALTTVGVPESTPVAVLNVAHVGLLVIE